MTLGKTAEGYTSGGALVGDPIIYHYTVTNTGTVTLTNVAVVDSPLGPVSLDKTTLAPTEQATGTLTKLVGEGDICGSINNTADASATAPCSGSASAHAEATVPTNYVAAIEIDKSADVSSASIGDVINYTYNVTNTGDVDLSDLEIEDDQLGSIDTKGE
jgi:uncharacterized membrane protein